MVSVRASVDGDSWKVMSDWIFQIGNDDGMWVPSSIELSHLARRVETRWSRCCRGRLQNILQQRTSLGRWAPTKKKCITQNSCRKIKRDKNLNRKVDDDDAQKIVNKAWTPCQLLCPVSEANILWKCVERARFLLESEPESIWSKPVARRTHQSWKSPLLGKLLSK